MRAPLLALAAMVAVSACTPGQGSVGAGPELASVFRFAEYPDARFINETVHGSSVGPFAMPGNSGSRVYETTASVGALKSHYETLAQTHGWTLSVTDPDRVGLPPGEPFRGVLATLVRDRFNFSVIVAPTSDGLPLYGGPYPHPQKPRPVEPAYGAPTPPPPPGWTPAPSPSPSPSVAPTPTPTPYAGALYLRIEGNVLSR